MNCDLHIHSNYSTGNQSLEEIITEALSKDIQLISITDDDSMEAYYELPDLALKMGIFYIKGVQVSASKDGQIFRLLAYGYASEHEELSKLLQINRKMWDIYGEKIITYMTDYYPELSIDGYRQHKKDTSYGGFKYNSYLNSLGLDGTDSGVVLFFKKHIEDIKKMVQQMPFTPVEDVIRIIHDAGGRAIVPGGYLRNPDTFAVELDSLMKLGVDGLEVYSASYDEDMSVAVRKYAVKYNLLITGGGDGHGSWASQDKYAIGIKDVEISELQLGDMKIYPEG
jgi:hypothetical protein